MWIYFMIFMSLDLTCWAKRVNTKKKSYVLCFQMVHSSNNRTIEIIINETWHTFYVHH